MKFILSHKLADGNTPSRREEGEHERNGSRISFPSATYLAMVFTFRRANPVSAIPPTRERPQALRILLSLSERRPRRRSARDARSRKSLGSATSEEIGGGARRALPVWG